MDPDAHVDARCGLAQCGRLRPGRLLAKPIPAHAEGFRESRIATAPGVSTSPATMAIHHAERHVTSRAASSRTLHSYYSAAIQNRNHAQYPVDEAGRPETAMSLAYTTPRNQIRQSRQSHRAPPPPPMPVDMPLPPTPTMAKGGMSRGSRQTLGSSQWTGAGGDEGDTESQWVELEDEWVDVTGSGEELESWGRGGRGVGILGLICVTVCTVSSSRP